MEVEDTNKLFKFEDDVSKKGTSVKYINFFDSTFRFSEEQKKTLKAICKGFFFYSKTKRMWGFTNRGNNEINVYNYILLGTIPNELLQEQINLVSQIRPEPLPFKVEDFTITFVDLKGRPLFYHIINNGIIEISINLDHWFFQYKNDSEKEFAKKIILSLVGTEYEFTSKVIESYFTKLHIIQTNLQGDYEKI